MCRYTGAKEAGALRAEGKEYIVQEVRAGCGGDGVHWLKRERIGAASKKVTSTQQLALQFALVSLLQCSSFSIIRIPLLSACLVPCRETSCSSVSMSEDLVP